MIHQLTDDEMNDLRITLLEFFSDSGKSFTDLTESGVVDTYLERLDENKIRDFLSGLCDPTGFVFYNGSTRNRQYRTTKMGRAMLLIYKGEAQLPDPDE